MGWFAVRALENDVYLLAEPPHVNSFLVVGGERAALIDSGLGIADIAEVVRSITPRPVTVCNTHSHWDHIGGNARFAEIAIHESGADLIGEVVPSEMLAEYWRLNGDPVLAELERFRAVDGRHFSLLTDETTPRPLPEGFNAAEWTIVPTKPTRVLRDGEDLDLGGRTLTVVHTPGHSADSVCYVDRDAGIAFTGDTVNSGPHYAHGSDSDLQAFARSTARLAALAPSVVYMAHYVRYRESATYLREVAGGFAAAAAGEVDWHPGRDCFEEPVREARFARFSIFADSEPAG